MNEIHEPRTAGDEPPVLCVVDDDEMTVQLVRDVASESGWVSYGFRRLSDARAFLVGRRPALVVLDDDLPDGRGGDLARELRENPEMDGVDLVMCTAAHPARQAELGEVVPVMSKPFDLGELESHLTGRRRRQQHSQGAR